MKRIGRWAIAATAAGAILANGAAARAGQAAGSSAVPCTFTIHNLGVLAGDFAGTASGINNASKAVGSSETFDPVNFDPVRPVLFASPVIAFHTLPNEVPGLAFGDAVAISDSGVAVGTIFDPKRLATHAAQFTYSTVDLGTLLFGSNSFATSINNLGEIVGYAEAVIPANGPKLNHAVRYAGGKVIDLGVLTAEGESFATGVNSQGVVVGYATTASGATHAVSFAQGHAVDFGVPPGGSDSRALGINKLGHAVGAADFGSGKDHAAMFINRRIIDLGTLSGGTTSTATAINGADYAVGWSDDGGTFVHPVLFARGHVIDLGTAAGIGNAYPAAINDLNQVVGTVQTTNSPISDAEQTLAALWTPTSSCNLSSQSAQESGPAP